MESCDHSLVSPQIRQIRSVQIPKLEPRIPLTARVLCRPDEEKPERYRAGTINLTCNFDVQLCRWGPSKRTGPGVQYCEEDRRAVLEQGIDIHTEEHKSRFVSHGKSSSLAFLLFTMSCRDETAAHVSAQRVLCLQSCMDKAPSSPSRGYDRGGSGRSGGTC